MVSINHRQGSALVFSLFILFFMGTAMMASLSLFTAQVEAMSREHSRTVAFHLAEGGIDWALARLGRNRAYRGEANHRLGDGSFSVTVSRQGNRFVIESTGRVAGVKGPIVQKMKATSHFSGIRPVMDHWEQTSP